MEEEATPLGRFILSGPVQQLQVEEAMTFHLRALGTCPSIFNCHSENDVHG